MYLIPTSFGAKVCGVGLTVAQDHYLSDEDAVPRAFGFDGIKDYVDQLPGKFRLGSFLLSMFMHNNNPYRIDKDDIFWYQQHDESPYAFATLLSKFYRDHKLNEIIVFYNWGIDLGMEVFMVTLPMDAVRGCVGCGNAKDEDLWFCSDWKG